MPSNFLSGLGGFFPGMAEGLKVSKALQELDLSGSYADDVKKASGTKGNVTSRDYMPAGSDPAPNATVTASPSGQAPATAAPAPNPPAPEQAIPLNPPTTVTRVAPTEGTYTPVPKTGPSAISRPQTYTPVQIPDTRPPPTIQPDGQQTIQQAKDAVGGAIGAGLRYLPQVFQSQANPNLYPTGDGNAY